MNIEKIKISKQLKDISKYEADEDLLNLMDYNKDNLNVCVGNKYLDYYFFPYRLNTVSKKGLNFYDFLKNDEVLEKSYIKKFIDNNKKRNMMIRIYDSFRIYQGSISQFKPVIAKYIYNKYDCNSILDPSMGWGGRLLGAILCNKKYIGFDTNILLKEPYKNMINDLSCNDKVNINFMDSAKVDYSLYKYDMVMTSPPYYKKERYDNMPIYKNYENWYETFYKPMVLNSYKYLDDKGHFILNIPEKIYNDTIKLLGECHEKVEYIFVKRYKESKYKEYIYVWKKQI